MDERELRQEAELRLGTDILLGVQDWYEKTIQAPQDYVIYIVRRSYLLALMMEKMTGVRMGKKEKYLTDAAFLLQCDKLAEQYRRSHSFPSILLCDDILIHGRNINHFLVELEKCLQEKLSEFDGEEIQYALVRALKIYVYARTDEPLLLLGRYELNLKYLRREKPVFIKKLSSGISSLIVYSGMANASYVYSDWIVDTQVEKLDLGKWKKTVYQGVEQYVWMRVLGKPSHVKAIYTIRLLSNRFGGRRMIPFVFLPNLDEKETWKLISYIFGKMEQNGFVHGELQWIIEWEKQKGKRSFNELLTLILSSAILKICKTEWGIQGADEEKEQEIDKLVRNYRQKDWESTENFIRKIVSLDLFTVEELDRILLDVISDERQVVSVFDDGEELKVDEQMYMIDVLENYFYKQGRQEEIEAYQLSIRPYSENSRRFRRTARGCCFLLNGLADGYSLGQAEYMTAYFLQMMDAGVLTLSSYAPSNVNVVGYTQYAKPGEQSLLLEVLNKYEYMPLLCDMQTQCWRIGIEMIEGLRRYAESSLCDLPPGMGKQLEQFVSNLAEMGQRPSDWNSNYLSKIDERYHIQRHGMKDISEYMERQREHIKNYRNYLEREVFA